MFIIGFFCHSIANHIKNLGAKKFSCHVWIYLISKIVPPRGCLGAAEDQTMFSAAAVIIAQKRAMGTPKGSRLCSFH